MAGASGELRATPRSVPRWLRLLFIGAIPISMLALWADTYFAPPWLSPLRFTLAINRGEIERLAEGGRVLDRISTWGEQEPPWFERGELWTQARAGTTLEEWIVKFVPDATAIGVQNGGTRGRDLTLLPAEDPPHDLTLQVVEQEDVLEAQETGAAIPVLRIRDFLLETPRGVDLITLIVVHDFSREVAWAVALRSLDSAKRHVGLWSFDAGQIRTGRRWSWKLWGRREVVFEPTLSIGADSSWSGARPEELVPIGLDALSATGGSR